jgi:uncharacterized protein (TIGR03435 family)
LAILAALFAVNASVLSGRQRSIDPPNDSRPAFDVAAVKSNRTDDVPTSRFPLGLGDAFTPGGLFLAKNQPLIAYLRFAFRVADFGRLPSWVAVERFDIEARAAGAPSKDDMRLMMQELLKERFGLRMHGELSVADGLALTVARKGTLGPGLRQADRAKCSESDRSTELITCGRIGPSSSSVPGRLRVAGRAVSISRLATFLTNPATGIDRPVFDHTELTGLFDVDIEWTGDVNDSVTESKAEDLTFIQALHDQLGLNLKRAKGRVEVVVIDRIDRAKSD